MIQIINDYFKEKLVQFPKITGYVCGSDEMALREAVSKFGSYYMFVDYGALSSDTDRNNSIDTSMEVAVTIAIPLGTRSVSWEDIFREQMKCFDMITTLCKTMYKDDRETRSVKMLSKKYDILQFVAPDICRSVGYTLSFRIEGKDLLDVK